RRKLDATHLDLERVDDIIGEVEGQVKSLKLQLKRFERHHKLSGELKEHELALARLQLAALDVEMKPLTESLASGRQAHSSEAALIAEEEGRLAEHLATLAEGEKELGASRNRLTEAGETHAKTKEQLLVWNEQLRGARESLTRAGEDQASETQRRQDIQAEIAELEKQLLEWTPRLESSQAAFDQKRTEEEAITAAYQEGERKLEVAREGIFNHRHAMQDGEARRERAGKAIEDQQQEAARIEEAIVERSGAQDSAHQQVQASQAQAAEKEKQLAGLTRREGQLKARLRDLDRRAAELLEDRHGHATQAEVLQSRLDIFTQLMDSYAGYPGGARELLADRAQFPGLLGTVAGMAEVAPEHAMAVEIALGPFATCLVTHTAAEARKLLAHAAENGLGRLSIIPLERIQMSAAPAASSANSPPGRPLKSLVTVPPEVAGLYDVLLDGYYWTAGEPPAGDELPSGTTVVTEAGHLAGAVPFFTHSGDGRAGEGEGADPAAGTFIVGRSTEMAQIRAALEEALSKAQTSEKEHDRVKGEREELVRQQQQLEREVEALQHELTGLRKDLTQREFERQRLSDEVDGLKRELPAVRAAMAVLEETVSAADEALAELSDRGEQLEQAADGAQTGYDVVRQRRDAWQGELQDLRLELLTMENQRGKVAERKLSMEDSLMATGQRLAKLKEESQRARDTIEEITRLSAEGEAQLADQEEETGVQRSAVEKEEGSVKDLRDAVSRLEEQIRRRQHGREATLSQHGELEGNLAELRKQEALVRSRIRDLYGEDAPAPQEGDETLDETALRASIDKAQGSLDRIGPINMAVAEEYAEESKRHTFLSEQREDLQQAEESLGETVTRLDQQARQQFRETFDKIRHHFKQTFTLFFDGGQGDLNLVGDPDPLLSGIEIVAQLPGKKTRSLRALSGGEKALTAIALLFATYLVKPSPFCVLDEVDAPLDDVNIEKFSRVIQQFAKDTQFIIVTHNKLTMQNVDYLYGVTMAEEGLSSLVSVDLQEYASQG
ncbi:MAG: chromosome segregation protein SMC, partial [Candidatus Neomarinimicrobiota bacterium]